MAQPIIDSSMTQSRGMMGAAKRVNAIEAQDDRARERAISIL